MPEAVKFCDAEQDDAHVVVITDSNVDELYSEPVSNALQEAGAQIDVDPERCVPEGQAVSCVRAGRDGARGEGP